MGKSETAADFISRVEALVNTLRVYGIEKADLEKREIYLEKTRQEFREVFDTRRRMGQLDNMSIDAITTAMENEDVALGMGRYTSSGSQGTRAYLGADRPPAPSIRAPGQKPEWMADTPEGRRLRDERAQNAKFPGCMCCGGKHYMQDCPKATKAMILNPRSAPLYKAIVERRTRLMRGENPPPCKLSGNQIAKLAASAQAGQQQQPPNSSDEGEKEGKDGAALALMATGDLDMVDTTADPLSRHTTATGVFGRDQWTW